MKDLIIVGGGGFGRELLQWCKDVNDIEHKWNIKGFIDDNESALSDYDCDYGIIGTIKDWQPSEDEEFVIALGFPAVKQKVIQSLSKRGAAIVSLIHPDAHIGGFCKIGKGCIIYLIRELLLMLQLGTM